MADRVLLFDLGGVLVENDMFSALKRLMGTDASPAELVERWLANPVARRFELGRCEADEFAASIIRELELPLGPREFLTAFASWPRGFSAGALALLEQLRSRHRVACLSNSNAVHWAGHLTQPFDAAFSSHLIGHIKPDPEAFRYVLSSLDVAPARVLYFDDAQSNVDTARALGIEAYRTVGFEALKARLQGLGVIG